MSLRETLLARSNAQCELCQSQDNLDLVEVTPTKNVNEESALILCGTCRGNVTSTDPLDASAWNCLHQSIWSEYLPVKIISWRLLQRIKEKSWAQDLLDQLYLEDEALNWAKEGMPEEESFSGGSLTVDSNGTPLQDGDSVTLIKDLDVKGAGFTAKRGTLVKNISLTNNPKHIEGRVNGIQIVLVAAYLKKA
jgi:protein PhnA